MTRRDAEPMPDFIIERAAELWARKLHDPRFDNGDDSPHGGVTFALATLNIARAQDADTTNDFDAKVAAFKTALIERLTFDRDHEGETRAETGRAVYLDTFLSVDYHPDEALSMSATAAGIDHRLFSVKSDVTMRASYNGSLPYVTTKFGYGAPSDYHYRLSDGRWLICRLSGDHMATVIAAVEAGTFSVGTIEAAP
jgi:hypothetical protein